MAASREIDSLQGGLCFVQEVVVWSVRQRRDSAHLT